MSEYLRVQLDESFLDKAFRQIEVRLDGHEAMIRELQRLLRDKADRSGLRELSETLNSQLDAQLAGLKSAQGAIESRVDSQCKECEARLLAHISDRLITFEVAVQDRARDARIDALIDRCGCIANDQSRTRESVQQIAAAIAVLSGGAAALDHTLPDTMGASIAFVRGNFSSLYEELQKMKQLFESLSAQGERGGETAPQREPHREIEPRPPKELPRERKSAPRRPLSPGQALKRETVVVDAPLNFSDYRPYPPIVAHWSDPPELPGIYPFPSMGNWLDYFYRMVPKLQAHLTAIHSKVADLNHEFTVKMDRGFLEKMYDTFQSIVAELKNDFEELKHGLEETATREEINGIIENLFGSMNIETETSVGRVKCIACGREMNKVVGALTETEISRALGTPPNSIAFHAGPAAAPIGVAYQSRDGFDGAIVESPRAVRPFRQAQARRKWKPFHPST